MIILNEKEMWKAVTLDEVMEAVAYLVPSAGGLPVFYGASPL